METQKRDTVIFKRPFKPGYDMLPAKFQNEVQAEIMIDSGFGLNSFIGKKFGRVPIRPHEKVVIERVFKKFNLDPWTGKYLS